MRDADVACRLHALGEGPIEKRSDAALFDLANEYDSMLAEGLRLTGEDRGFYLRGRVEGLVRSLEGDTPHRVLDFGCGLGDTSVHLAEVFPEAVVTGVDTAEGALVHARKLHGGARVAFLPVDEIELGIYDLCYVNGVFHHIEPERRDRALGTIFDALRPGGWFAFFENNPWNIGTRIVMSRVAFDDDAVLMTPPAARRLLQGAGFETPFATRSLFYFPSALRGLRPLEPALGRLPLGGQYFILARRP